jgi:hypothetical protein
MITATCIQCGRKVRGIPVEQVLRWIRPIAAKKALRLISPYSEVMSCNFCRVWFSLPENKNVLEDFAEKVANYKQI